MYSKLKKPLVAGVVIVGLAVLISTTTYIASSFTNNDVLDPLDPKYLEALLEKYEQCKKEGKNPINVFSVDELANITTYKFSKNKNYLVIGSGTNECVFTKVTVTNAVIKNNNYALEESISFSSGLGSQFAKSRRDYLYEDVTSYEGHSDQEKYKAKWDLSSKVVATISDFYNDSGKLPSDPFVYDVNKNTVLETSKIETIENGYKLFLDLDTEKSTTRYAKRMKHVAGISANRFDSVTLTLFVDNDFNIRKSEINDEYIMLGFVTTYEKLEAKYYTDNIPNIPDINTDFDYSKYI